MIAYTIAIPFLDKAKETGILNEGYKNIQTLESLIREVASEGIGSLRTIQLAVTGGNYFVDNNTGEVYFSLDSKSDVYQSGTFIKNGNILTVAGQGVSAINNGTNLILENKLLKLVFNKVGNESYFENIDTSENIKNVYLKKIDTNINPLDSSIYIDNTVLTGNGYSRIVRIGSNLALGEVLFHINSTIGVVDAIYSLKADADFIDMKVRNVSSNQSSVIFIYHIGLNGTGDYIKIDEGEETDYSSGIPTPSPVCYQSTDTNKFYSCSFDNSTEVNDTVLVGLIYSGSSNHFVKMCYSDFSSTDYKFNVTSNGELETILAFAKGNCDAINNKYYQIENQRYFASSIADYGLANEGAKVQFILQFDRIVLQGKDKIGSGTHKICIEKIGEADNKAIVEIRRC
jgi:hypothetical protein